MSYKDLKLKIKEVFGTQEAFAEAMDMERVPLNQRLNGKVQWKMPEVVKACGLLHIPLEESHLYFFVAKV